MTIYGMWHTGTCAFGLQLNAIDRSDTGFRKYGRTLFQPSLRFLVRELSSMISPALRKALPLNDFPQDAIDFFTGAFTDTMNERTRNNVVRKDVMQSLIQARTDLVVNKTEPSGKLDTNSISEFVIRKTLGSSFKAKRFNPIYIYIMIGLKNDLKIVFAQLLFIRWKLAKRLLFFFRKKTDKIRFLFQRFRRVVRNMPIR